MITNKQRMRTLLAGGVPDVPPHWELVFQIERDFFGLPDGDLIRHADYPSQQARLDAIWRHELLIYTRCVDDLQWGAVPGGYDHRQVSLFKKELGEQALIAGYEGGGVFWMPNGGNMMDFATRLYEHPEDLAAEARSKCDAAKDQFARLVDAGADFLVGAYDFGYNDAPFISPDHFRRFVTPYLAELADKAHSLGVKIILHSDGCLTRVLDQIHSTGIDGYQSVDPQGHMDIRQVRAQYPDWLLMGNVACNLMQDTDENRIRASVQYCMAHGGIGGRYIFSTSNCIFAGMPPDSYRVMLDEYRQCINSYNERR